jgi:hypothetical protein
MEHLAGYDRHDGTSSRRNLAVERFPWTRLSHFIEFVRIPDRLACAPLVRLRFVRLRRHHADMASSTRRDPDVLIRIQDRQLNVITRQQR